MAKVEKFRDLLDAPCIICGYNGERYWQGGSHKWNCPFHKIGGRDDRAYELSQIVLEFLKNLIPKGGSQFPGDYTIDEDGLRALGHFLKEEYAGKTVEIHIKEEMENEE